VSIPSSGIINYGIETRVARYENGTYYVQISHDDGPSETVYKSSDADVVINYAISISIGGTVFVANTGSDYEIDSGIHMKSGVTLILDNNTVIRQIAGGGLISFAGNDVSHRLSYANVDSLGRATLLGSGLGDSAGVTMYYCDYCSLKNVEIANTGGRLISIRQSHYNVLENIYAHRYALSSGGHGITCNSGGHNKFINVIVDAENVPGSTTCLYIGADYEDAEYNEIIGGEYKNSDQGNGVYLSSTPYSVDHVTMINVTVSGCRDPGHSGLKIRPCSYNTIIGLVSENNHNGIEMGTRMSPSDYVGSSSIGNYIQGIVRNNDNVGLILYIDYNEYSIANNIFDLTVEGNKDNGVWMTTSGRSNVEIENNTLNLICRNNGDVNNAGVYMIADGTGYIRRNRISGIFENNSDHGIYVGGANCIDNKFDFIAANNALGSILDFGTRTRVNGVGKEAAGIGNAPSTTLWDVGDIVKNTDDNSVWIKNANGTMSLLTHPKARFATFFTCNTTIVQFIDQSYDPNGNIISWNWAFGDLSISNEKNPSHDYSSFGDYVVSLSVENSDGLIDSITNVISVALTIKG
jgi:hypothetical protein